ncbi:hypothetical protein D4764_12G0010370 [Takifugu flavidus]|uniref:Secreted protein n=1 Tax=Takifugu flavidus TaxID=433684 RepID=A0A5C6PGY1_9TELE|nr:hypothetical protein D4764_12G0010370 [Takifugu flavidus]
MLELLGSFLCMSLVAVRSIHPSILYRLSGVGSRGQQPKKPRLPSPQLLPAHPEGSPGVARPVERYSLSNVPWVFPGVSYQRDMP